MQRRLLVHAGAWALATGAATTLTWWGVHTVLAATAYEPPRALPVSGTPLAEPGSSSTHWPKSGGQSGGSQPSSGTGDSRTPSLPGSGEQRGPSAGGTAEGASVRGGRAVFEMKPHSAALVSATPNSGWEMRVWKADGWIRVTFTQGDGTESSLLCRWDTGEPRIEKSEG